MAEDIQQPLRRHRAWDGPWQRWITGLLALLVVISAAALIWLDTSAGHRFLITRIDKISPPSRWMAWRCRST